MRIVFASRPAFGHVFAIAPLAAAARDARHDVMFASGEEFLPRLQSWGFETRKVGDGIESAFQRAAAEFPELLQPERPEFGGRMFVDVLGPRSLHDMTAVIEEWRPDLVVYEATDVGSGVAASAAGIPVVCHSLSVWTTAFIDAIRDRLGLLWEEAGADPAVDIALGDAFLDILATVDAISGGSCDGQTLATSAGRLGRCDYGGPRMGQDRRWAGSIRVAWDDLLGKELLTKVIQGLSDLDCDALVLAGVDATPDDFPTKSDRVHVTGFVNQAEVLRHADLVIHHGGAGTMLGTLARGLPALVLAQGADRPYTAASLEASGAGIAREPASVTSQDIADAVTTLLDDPGYRKRAREIKNEIASMPSPEQVVDRLPSLSARR